MFDEIARQVEINQWSQVFIYFGLSLHLLQKRLHFEESIRSFICHFLMKIQYAIERLGGWRVFESWSQMLENCDDKT